MLPVRAELCSLQNVYVEDLTPPNTSESDCNEKQGIERGDYVRWGFRVGANLNSLVSL